MNYYQDNLDKVFQDLSCVLELEPDHHKAKAILAKTISIKMKEEKGNSLFKEGKYEEAHEAYTEALGIDKLNTLVNAKLYYYRATKAVQLDKGFTKAFLRRAKCFMELESYDEAVKDY